MPESRSIVQCTRALPRNCVPAPGWPCECFLWLAPRLTHTALKRNIVIRIKSFVSIPNEESPWFVRPNYRPGIRVPTCIYYSICCRNKLLLCTFLSLQS